MIKIQIDERVVTLDVLEEIIEMLRVLHSSILKENSCDSCNPRYCTKGIVSGQVVDFECKEYKSRVAG